MLLKRASQTVDCFGEPELNQQVFKRPTQPLYGNRHLTFVAIMASASAFAIMVSLHLFYFPLKLLARRSTFSDQGVRRNKCGTDVSRPVVPGVGAGTGRKKREKKTSGKKERGSAASFPSVTVIIVIVLF